MPNDIVLQGVNLMVFGMGTVVVFLTLLVFVTTSMSRLLIRFSDETELALLNLSEANAGQINNAHLAAISAAIHKFRRRH